MTEEKKPFSFGTSFTAESQPTPEPEPTTSTNNNIGSLKTGESTEFTCTFDEAEAIFEETRADRQAGKLRVNYDIKTGILSAKKKK